MNRTKDRQTAHGKTAFAFARALADGDFDKAHQMLTKGLGSEFPPARLKERYEQMIAYAENASAIEVDVIVTHEEWSAKQLSDVGWAYASISGRDEEAGVWCEA